jgi:predicted methyltransferase
MSNPSTDPVAAARLFYAEDLRFTANIRSAAVRAAFGAALWAFLLDQLDVATGEQVLHLGCGSGYYTAVMAELIGPKGKVIDEFFQVEATSSAGPPANLSVPCSGCVTYAIDSDQICGMKPAISMN